MFEKKSMMFMYVETPLHVGAGRGTGAVDLPIQRERSTGYPMIQASSLKGCLRSAFGLSKNLKDDAPEVTDIFGKAGSAGENFAGAVSPGDARLLLFPVRSLAGVFAWTTSVHALATFKRSCELADISISWGLPAEPSADGDVETILVSSSTNLTIQDDTVVLEEFSFNSQKDEIVDQIAEWLGENAFPTLDTYWKNSLPGRLCVLPEDVFRDFCMYATEVQTHIKLNTDTKTVDKGALWTSESIPVDSLLYTPLMASRVHRPDAITPAEDVLAEVIGLDLTHLQIGGDETKGQGWTSIRFLMEVE